VKTMHVTGVDFADPGTIIVRVVTVSRRWWQRRDHHKLNIWVGTLGQWQNMQSGKYAPPGVSVFLDRAFTDSMDRAAAAMQDFRFAPPRAVARPSSGVQLPED
jgi:hypothetical protein